MTCSPLPLLSCSYFSFMKKYWPHIAEAALAERKKAGVISKEEEEKVREGIKIVQMGGFPQVP